MKKLLLVLVLLAATLVFAAMYKRSCSDSHQPWLAHHNLAEQIASHSTLKMGELIGVEEEQISKTKPFCTSKTLRGIFQDSATGKNYEWSKALLKDRAVYAVQSSGHSEQLTLTERSWSLTLDQKSVVRDEPYRDR